MSGSLKDLLVVCSLDRALRVPHHGVPGCNRATVELFTQLGGRFTVVTERTPASIKEALDGVHLSSPAIACGGSMLYEVEEGVRLDDNFLPQEPVRELAAQIAERFPEVGIEVFLDEGQLYVPQTNRYVQKHLLNEKIGCIISPLEEITGNWSKLTFIGDPVTISKIKNQLQGQAAEGFCFQESGMSRYEILPAASGRVKMLEALAEYEGVPLENIIVIGESDYDKELMRAAGHAVAVRSASNRIQLEADEIVPGCAEGGVGEYLYALVKRYT